jgi:hypothetical protein
MISFDDAFREWRNLPLFKGKSFDDLFRIDGIPYGWFISRLFKESVLPSQVNPYPYLRKGVRLPVMAQYKFRSASIIGPKYLLYKEKRKVDGFRMKRRFSSGNKVLFFSYSNHIGGSGEIFRLAGIIDEVRKGAEPFLLFADPLSMDNHKLLKDHENIYQYHDPSDEVMMGSRSRSMARRWAMVPGSKKKSIGRNVWHYFGDAINMYMSREFIFLVDMYYHMFKRAIDKEGIRAVVATGSVGFFEKCLFGAAKTMGIPGFSIQHGIGSRITISDPPELLDNARMLVFSDKTKTYYMKKAVNPAALEVVGPMLYDDIVRYQTKAPNKRKILIATSPLVEFLAQEKEEYFRKIEWLMRSLKGYRLTFKLHPRERYLRSYLSIAKRVGGNIKVIGGTTTGKEFYRLMKDSDIFLHFGSNAALEAMIIGRPTILVDMVGDLKKRVNWLDGTKVLKVKYGDDILKKIQDISKRKDFWKIQESLIKEHAGIVDGRACNRAASVILESIKRA